jgi:hypothetical protein
MTNIQGLGHVTIRIRLKGPYCPFKKSVIEDHVVIQDPYMIRVTAALEGIVPGRINTDVSFKPNIFHARQSKNNLELHANGLRGVPAAVVNDIKPPRLNFTLKDAIQYAFGIFDVVSDRDHTIDS